MSDNVIQIDDARSGTDSQNVQEILDATDNPGQALRVGQAQYQTPPSFARSQAGLLPYQSVSTAYDPQCAGNNLLMSVSATRRYGTDIDKRFNAQQDGTQRITGNCVKIWEIFEEVYAKEGLKIKFQMILANPPFGIKWKQTGKKSIDSTQWTWELIQKRLMRGGCGYMIAGADTLERLEINKHPWVYLYQRYLPGGIFDGVDIPIGVVHFVNRRTPEKIERYEHVWDEHPTPFKIAMLGQCCNLGPTDKDVPYPEYFDYQWAEGAKIVKEEASSHHSEWNIFLNKEGVLRTYLSTRHSKKLDPSDIEALSHINGCRPITLTTEVETRKVLHRMLTAGIYTIEPNAKTAILNALAEVVSMACPIRDVTSFERVAYTEEEESLFCKAKDPRGKLALTVGKHYPLKTGTYGFKDTFITKKLYTDIETGETTLNDHDCELRGQDRYVEIVDDRGHIQRFMDRPTEGVQFEHPEALLWDIFEEPYVPTVKETQPEQYQKNIECLNLNEMISGFTYFRGQLDYFARLGCKDYGVMAADVGCGKTLGALSLIMMKSPRRTLICAPQGTMRSSGSEDDEDGEEYQASQWVTEIRRFAPTEPCFQLFSYDDWQNILHANGGELPPGIYITYPQAYFMNNAFEYVPNALNKASKWNNVEKGFCDEFALPYDKDRANDMLFSNGLEKSNKQGIRCIAKPNLNTLIDARHGTNVWDMVIMDEAHLICNQDAQISQSLLRVQPKFRFLMTATPIPNIISNIFSLMGWCCVPDWYKGDVCNAAWPYTMNDKGRFERTFLSQEVDLTALAKNKAKGKKGGNCTTLSPIISSPARLLKLLKPSMAYISKEDCNPDVMKADIIDVRVEVGAQQAKMYNHWMKRINYMREFIEAGKKPNPMRIACLQSGRLRGTTAAPASQPYSKAYPTPAAEEKVRLCNSNYNPKLQMIMELAHQCLAKGEQVVIVSAFIAQSNEVATRLREALIPIARIDSTVKAELHTSEANRFKKGQARVMIMGIKCAQGHSFDQCPNLIIGSLEWSYGSLHQAKGRVHRLTSPVPVKVWVVLHKGTIEEMLFDRVALKQDAATICLLGKRVPRDFKPFDKNEVMAEHVANFEGIHESTSEVECEQDWPDLREKLRFTNKPGGEPVGLKKAWRKVA